MLARTTLLPAAAVRCLVACHRTAEPDAGSTSQPSELEQAVAPPSDTAAAPCGLDAPCAEGQWCDYGDGLCGAGAQGTCAPRPQMCVQIFQPVCGCDGRTHGNACAGQMEGVDVHYPGECAPEGSGSR